MTGNLSSLLMALVLTGCDNSTVAQQHQESTPTTPHPQYIPPSPAEELASLREQLAALPATPSSRRTNLLLRIVKLDPEDTAAVAEVNQIQLDLVAKESAMKSMSDSEFCRHVAGNRDDSQVVAEFVRRGGRRGEESLAGSKRFKIGMTALAARCALGNPDRINRTFNARGTDEQWVYGYAYVYIENGIVTSVQN